MKTIKSTFELLKYYLRNGCEINLDVNFNADGRGQRTIFQKIFRENEVLDSPIHYSAYLECLEYLDEELAEIYIDQLSEDDSLDMDDLSSSFKFSIKLDGQENLELHFLNNRKVNSDIPFELLQDEVVYHVNPLTINVLNKTTAKIPAVFYFVVVKNKCLEKNYPSGFKKFKSDFEIKAYDDNISVLSFMTAQYRDNFIAEVLQGVNLKRYEHFVIGEESLYHAVEEREVAISSPNVDDVNWLKTYSLPEGNFVEFKES